MRASWPGIRLSLTCRRLQAQITDELADRWAIRVVETYTDFMDLDDTTTLEAIHHELPNGTFHGPANVEDYVFQYRRGQMISGDRINPNCPRSYFYHKNMLVLDKNRFRSRDMFLCIITGALIFGSPYDESWALNIKNAAGISDPVAWYEKMLPEIRSQTGDKFERHVGAAENRPKVSVYTTFVGVTQWPDCQLWE